MVWLPPAPRRRRQGRRAQRPRIEIHRRAAAARGGRRQGGDQQRGQLGAELEGGARTLRGDATHAAVVGAAPPRSFNLAPLSARPFARVTCTGCGRGLHRASARRCTRPSPRAATTARSGASARHRYGSWILRSTFRPLPHVHAAAAAGDAAARPERVGAHLKNDKYNAGWLVPDAPGCRRASAPISSSCGGTCSRRERDGPRGGAETNLSAAAVPVPVRPVRGRTSSKPAPTRSPILRCRSSALSRTFSPYRFRELGARAGRLAAARQPPPRLDIQLRARIPDEPAAAARRARRRRHARRRAQRVGRRRAPRRRSPHHRRRVGRAGARGGGVVPAARQRGGAPGEFRGRAWRVGGGGGRARVRDGDVASRDGLSCAASWYKPSGVPVRRPAADGRAAEGCGEGDAAAAAALPECAALQAKRRAAQRPSTSTTCATAGRTGTC